MAAHIVTALKEALELNEAGQYTEGQHALFQYALDHAAWGGQADYVSGDWRDLHTLLPADFIETVKRILPKYEAQWKELGEPGNWEDWYTKQFGHPPFGEV